MRRSQIRYHTKRLTDSRYKYLASAIKKIDEVHPTGKGKFSLLDIGCSVGALLREFDDYNGANLVGIDKSDVAKEHFCSTKAKFHQVDLNIVEELPYEINGSYKYITCFEVAEHLENPHNLIHILQTHNNFNFILLFSAAYPGQPGKGHISCKYHATWRNMIEQDYGWKYDQLLTSFFIYELGKANHRRVRVPIYYLNTMIFQRAWDRHSDDKLKHHSNPWNIYK